MAYQALTETVKLGGRTLAWVREETIDRVLASFLEKKIDGLAVPPKAAFGAGTLGRLLEFTGVKAVAIPEPEGFDLSILFAMPELRVLKLGAREYPIDFSRLDNLEELDICWRRGDALPGERSGLRGLVVSRFSTASKSLAELPAFARLNSLELIQGNLRSLDGIERLTSLQRCQLHHMVRLEKIGRLADTGVVELTLSHCARVSDFVTLAGCRALRVLRYNHCGELASLAVLRSMHCLDEFRFVGTVIRDGDMSPLLGLKKVGFSDRKAYSHTERQVRQSIGDASTV